MNFLCLLRLKLKYINTRMSRAWKKAQGRLSCCVYTQDAGLTTSNSLHAVLLKLDCANKSLGAVGKIRSLIQQVWGRGLRLCISNKFPCDVDAADLEPPSEQQNIALLRCWGLVYWRTGHGIKETFLPKWRIWEPSEQL